MGDFAGRPAPWPLGTFLGDPLAKAGEVAKGSPPKVAGRGLGRFVAVVTLVAGVEPILTAAPSGSAAAALLSSWNMSAGGAPAEPCDEPLLDLEARDGTERQGLET